MIVVLDYGIGNLASAEKALVHLGAPARRITDPGDADGATGVVLPGVGHFGACARALRESGLDVVATGAIATGLPFIGICVGFQLLFEGSEESPGTAGLGVLEGEVRRLSGSEKLPQMQWNTLVRRGQPAAMLAGLEESPWCYFVHSFAPDPPDLDAAGVVATCTYGGRVVAALERGRCWGTQFHPEKSGRAGLAVLSNFLGLVARYERAGGAPLPGAPLPGAPAPETA